MRSLFALLSLCFLGCSTTGDPLPSSPDAGSDADADIDANADSDADADVADADVADADEQPECIAPRCSDAWSCCQDSCDVTQLRVTAFRFTYPTILTEVQDEMNEALDDFRFPWLIELDLIAERVRLGAGTVRADPPQTLEDFCRDGWDRDDPSSEWVDIELDGLTFSTASRISAANIDFYSESTHSQLFELPLVNIELNNIGLNDSHTLVGTPHNSPGQHNYAAWWDSELSTLSAWIEWNDAHEAYMPVLGMTLCSLLCGMNCDLVAIPEACFVQPAEIPGTDNVGYALTASIGAGAVTIVER